MHKLQQDYKIFMDKRLYGKKYAPEMESYLANLPDMADNLKEISIEIGDSADPDEDE